MAGGQRKRAADSRKRPGSLSRRSIIATVPAVVSSIIMPGIDPLRASPAIHNWQRGPADWSDARAIRGAWRDRLDGPSPEDAPKENQEGVAWAMERAKRYGCTVADPKDLTMQLSLAKTNDEALTALRQFAKENFFLDLQWDEPSPPSWEDILSIYQAVISLNFLPRELHLARAMTKPLDLFMERDVLRLRRNISKKCGEYTAGCEEFDRMYVALQQDKKINGDEPVSVGYVLVHEYGHMLEGRLLPGFAKLIHEMDPPGFEFVTFEEWSKDVRTKPGGFKNEFPLATARSYAHVKTESVSTLMECLPFSDLDNMEGFDASELDPSKTSVRVRKLSYLTAALSRAVAHALPDKSVNLAGYFANAFGCYRHPYENGPTYDNLSRHYRTTAEQASPIKFGQFPGPVDSSLRYGAYRDAPLSESRGKGVWLSFRNKNNWPVTVEVLHTDIPDAAGGKLFRWQPERTRRRMSADLRLRWAESLDGPLTREAVALVTVNNDHSITIEDHAGRPIGSVDVSPGKERSVA
jgi:hypothetical protein